MAAYAAYRHIELDNIGSGKKRITRPPGGESSDIFGASPTTTPPTTPRKVKNYMASTIFSPENGQQVKSRARPEDDSFKRLFGAKEGDMTPKKNHQKSNILFSEVEKVNGYTNGENGHAKVGINNGTANEISISNGNAKNGHVNGTNGSTDHANAANDHVNGTNGATHHANGSNGANRSNGTNGHANGVNGHVNGTNGHVNGTNGHSNGTNGHSNGYQRKNSSNGSISESSSGSATPNGSINGDNGSMPGTPSRRIPPGGYSTKLW